MDVGLAMCDTPSNGPQATTDEIVSFAEQTIAAEIQGIAGAFDSEDNTQIGCMGFAMGKLDDSVATEDAETPL